MIVDSWDRFNKKSIIYFIKHVLLDILLFLFPKVYEKTYVLNKFKKNDEQNFSEINNSIEKIRKNKINPLFTMMEIETINRCNNNCSFCPVNSENDNRKYKLMSKKLFIKIINELKELNYTGILGLYSNNEPLLDKRIIELCRIVKKEMPNVFLYIYTNGKLLDLNMTMELTKYLDKLVIDNYSSKKKLNKNIEVIYNKIKGNKELDKKIEIHLRRKNDFLTSRGGQQKNRTKINIKSKCLLPYTQFVVRPDGKVSLCCNDPFGKYTFGDLNTSKISEIWNNKKYFDFRENMYKTGRNKLLLCNDCDTLDVTNPNKIANLLKG